MAVLDDKQEREVIEAMRMQAKMTRAFYEALVEQRFSPIEALALTQTWLRAYHTRPPESR